MEKQFSAGIIVYKISEQGERLYLLLHYVQGHWDFPKGHLEVGETQEEAAIRELKEETGLTAQIRPGFGEEINYWLQFDNEKIYKTVTFFVGLAEGDQVKLSPEHSDFAWLAFDEAIHKLTYNNAKKVLTSVDDFLG